MANSDPVKHRENSRRGMRAMRARRRKQAENVSEAHPDRDLGVVAWCERHFPVRGGWQAPRFQRDWLDVMARDLGPPYGVFIAKSSQLGYTTALAAAAIYRLARDGWRIGAYLPTDGDALSFAKDTWGGHFDAGGALAIPCLEAQMSKWETKRKGKESVRLKLMPSGGELRTLGATSPARFRRYAGELVVLDELDAYEKSIGGEGDASVLALRALRNTDGRLIAGSTPSGAQGDSQILAAVAEASLRFRFEFPCPHCDQQDWLEWERLWWPDKGSPDSRSAAAAHTCQHCGAQWGHELLAERLELGRWRAKDCRIEDGELIGADGQPKPWPHSVGFTIWGGYSPWYPWPRLVRDWLGAQGNQERVRAFVEQSLGRIYTDAIHSNTADELAALAQQIDGWPDGATHLAAAIDVQGAQEREGWFSILVCALGAGERMWVLERHEIHGDASRPNAGAWVDLAHWMRGCRLFDRSLTYAVIDAGSPQNVVLQSAARLPVRTISVKGIGGFDRPEYARINVQVRGRKYALVKLGVDLLKGQVAKRLGEGEIVLSSSLDGKVFDELCSEHLTWRMTSERRRRRAWVKRSDDAANEAWDCAVYALGLSKVVAPMLLREAPRSPPANAPPPKPKQAPRRKRDPVLDALRARRGRRI